MLQAYQQVEHLMPSVFQDQKILELMLAKREEQVMEQERIEQAHRRWDAERERSVSAGAMRGKDRRSMMSGDRKLLREHVSALHCCHRSDGCTGDTICGSILELK